MRANFEKFLFLGVMIISTFFFSQKSQGDLARLSEEINDKDRNNNKASLILTLKAGEVNSLAGPEGATPLPTEDTDKLALTEELSGEVLDTPTSSFREQRQEERAEVFKAETVVSPSLGSGSVGASRGDLVFKRVGDEAAPPVSAQAAIVMALGTQDVYFEKNSDRRWPLASLTKLMTAALAVKKLDLESRVTISEEDLELSAGSANGLQAGETYSVYDLLRKMLITSSNEAAGALTRFYGRSDFIALMNDQAREWGLGNTNFRDPTGVSVSNQSTAEEIQRMAKKIYESYPEVFKIARRETWTITEFNSKRRVKILSNNDFAGRADFLGGKTGYTEEANGNLISIFSYGGEPLGIVVLGTDSRFEETTSLYEWFKRNYEY